jgi:hypothetical protein
MLVDIVTILLYHKDYFVVACLKLENYEMSFELFKYNFKFLHYNYTHNPMFVSILKNDGFDIVDDICYNL